MRNLELEGFVLTSQWRDTSAGVTLTFWLASESGPVRAQITGERAVMFVERGVRAHADERKPVALETLWREPVDALYFKRRRALMDERDRLREAGFGVLESDIRPTNRYLMERFITGGCRVWGRAESQRRHLEMVPTAMKSGDYRPKLSYLSIDIETDGSDGPVLSIAAHNDDIEQVWVAGVGPPAPSVRYVRDERALLSTFFAAVTEIDPDAIIGWSVVEFDLMHLQARAKHHGIRFGIGRGGERAAILVPQSENQLPLARIPGRVALDGIATLKAATHSFERYALQHVAHELLSLAVWRLTEF